MLVFIDNFRYSNSDSLKIERWWWHLAHYIENTKYTSMGNEMGYEIYIMRKSHNA